MATVKTAVMPAVEVQQGMVLLLPGPSGNFMPALIVRVRFGGTTDDPELCLEGLIRRPDEMIDDLQIECPPGYPVRVKL